MRKGHDLEFGRRPRNSRTSIWIVVLAVLVSNLVKNLREPISIYITRLRNCAQIFYLLNILLIYIIQVVVCLFLIFGTWGRRINSTLKSCEDPLKMISSIRIPETPPKSQIEAMHIRVEVRFNLFSNLKTILNNIFTAGNNQKHDGDREEINSLCFSARIVSTHIKIARYNLSS